MNDDKNKTILLDEKGICIHGKYRILLASSLFYFRIPEARWEERMELLKAAGYNTIDVYFPWNYHEQLPGEWSFEGNRDVVRFLKLAAEKELFVIARPGPYICSEWDGGGIPAWLWTNEIAVRQDDPEFLKQMDSWYGHILPLIAPFQITKGGTVICMQIENELDFYDCKSPDTYMEKLMQKAISHGIEVPLFYCCGQNDLLRGGGLTEGLYTAFNVYEQSDSQTLEERAYFLNRAAADRRMPFLITETNREHSFLKRLLVSGGKLISPYNQTAGTTPAWYTGITNWGSEEDPVSFMAGDYDFASMIGSAGEVTDEFYEARLLSALLLCLGEDLAQAVPGPDALLQMKNGSFLALSNLGEARKMELTLGAMDFTVCMPPLSTKLFPVELTLSAERELVLKGCNYELAWFSQKEQCIEVNLYGEGTFEAVLATGGVERRIRAERSREIDTLQEDMVTFVLASKEKLALGVIPGLPNMTRTVEEQRTWEKIDRITVCDREDFFLPEEREIITPVLPMEKLGQYRGMGSYRFELKEDCRLLLIHAGDILTVNSENKEEAGTAFFWPGGCLELAVPRGGCEVRTEIWGHSNFDDIRRPVLRMKSRKGIEKIVVIKERRDLSGNWLIDLDEQPKGEWYFFRHSSWNTLMSIDGYNRSVSPLCTVYDKWVDLPEDCDSLFLHFSKANCRIAVYVNGHFEGNVDPKDPYTELSRYASQRRIELTLRIDRTYFSDRVGEVTLLAGNSLPECRYAASTLEELQFPKEASGKDYCLPMEWEDSGEKLLSFLLPETKGKDCKLFLKGRDLKLTAIRNKKVAGRILLENETFPVVKGGRSDVIYFCGEEKEREVLLWCQPIGPAPCLMELELCAYHSVCS